MANLAAANVMHRKTRTAVSVLAVAVQVAMVMLLVGLANGTLGDIAERLRERRRGRALPAPRRLASCWGPPARSCR